DYFQNPTGSPIAAAVTILGNLGSDSATRVFATSSGASAPGVNDLWFGTDAGPGTTALIHILHGPAGLKPSSVSIIGDNVTWTYNITVQPGQTIELGTYTIQATAEASAVAQANVLVSDYGFGAHAADFMTSSELASLANFQFATNTVINSDPNSSTYGQ